MKSDEKPNSWERVMRILGGFEIAVICLVLLFIHTFYSTLEQQWLGLYGTIQKYFDLESLWVIPTNRHDKAICIPLPGAYWVMALLTLNMTIGGIIRMKKGWKKLGILISHFSIVFMMIAGGVSSLSKIEGNMIVVEGQKSDFAMKSHAPSIELAKYGEGGLREEPLVVPPESLQELEPSDTLTANFSDLGLVMKITGFHEASNLFQEQTGNEKIDEDGPTVDGFFLREAEWNKSNELANMAGAYATVEDTEGNLIQKLVVWMGNPTPVTFTYKGARYAVSMVSEIWPMPFEVELHKSVGEYYPGTTRPSSFESTISKVVGEGKEEVREDYKIFMNNPMRHGGFTLFQANWSPTGEGDRPYSGFAIVTNPSDQWPKYALYAATLGLTGHFVYMLIRYAGRSTRKSKPQPQES